MGEGRKIGVGGRKAGGGKEKRDEVVGGCGAPLGETRLILGSGWCAEHRVGRFVSVVGDDLEELLGAAYLAVDSELLCATIPRWHLMLVRGPGQ